MFKRYTFLFVILLLATAGCQQASDSPSENAASTPDDETASLMHYQVAVPEAWTTREPSTSMRLAEYEAPGDAEVVVYYFGPGQGGSVEDNIARWSSQFSTPEGGEVTPEVMSLDDAAFPITLAEYEGTYARNVGMGMGGEDEAKPDQALLAAVVETPEGNLFVQLFGPEASVAAQRQAYLDFVRSIKP